MTATTYERQPLTHYIGRAVADAEETKNGGATKVRFAVSDGFGDDAVTKFYDVVVTKEPLRSLVQKHVKKGNSLAISGTEKRDDYNPEKPRFTIFPAVISLAQNLKSLPDGDEF